ncbi:MAG: hypothetical protein ACTSRG_11225 [Candidatus Helarchaeota archaeon]
MSEFHNFEEIPDDSRTKHYLPLSKHVYKVFRQFGVEYMENFFPHFKQVQYDVTKARWDNMIYTGKKIMEGTIPEDEATKTVLYTVPHIVICRADLQVGTNKLLYGESTDVSFVIVDDNSEEILFIFNGHMEEGVPYDWWIEGFDSELLDRRHMKRGWKMREIPKKTKNFQAAAKLLMDTLKDIRNERTPEFQNSLYTVCMSWSSAMFNMFAEVSNYEMLSSIFNGLSCKHVFGLPDQYFMYYPVPPLFSSLIYTTRAKFTSMLAGLTCNHHLITSHVEDGAYNWVRDEFPELHELVFMTQWNKDGIPLPKATIEMEMETKKGKMFDKDGNIKIKYPEGTRIFMDDLELNEDNLFKGYILDIYHDTPLDITINRDLLISEGMGSYTKFYK